MMNNQIVVKNVPEEVHIVFAKILTKTDKEHQLILPTRVLNDFPVLLGHERDFTAFDRTGRAWPFVLAIRESEIYGKPVLRKAQWHEFVRAHNLGGLEEEHGVVFYKHQNYPMQVRTVGKVRLFGAGIGWAAVL